MVVSALPQDIAKVFLQDILEDRVALIIHATCECASGKRGVFCAGCMTAWRALRDLFNELTSEKKSKLTVALQDPIAWRAMKLKLGLTAQ